MLAAQPLGNLNRCPGSGGESAEQSRVDGHLFLWVQGSGCQVIEMQAALQDQARSFGGPLELVAVVSADSIPIAPKLPRLNQQSPVYWAWSPFAKLTGIDESRKLLCMSTRV